jgi:hypothetical protein
MSDDPPATGKVRFTQHHLPAMEAGQYRLRVEQTLATAAGDTETFATSSLFWVGGERFRLDPDEIDSVFPPPNTNGDYNNVLPHVVLSRPMLPWERSPTKGLAPHSARGDVAPWLALLVFDDSDPAPKLQSLTIGDLRNPPTGIISYPMARVEPGEVDTAPCQVLDIDAALFARIAPALADLPWLASVRSLTALAPGPGPDPAAEAAGFSVVVANRLPNMGTLTTAHLVSLEGMAEHLPGGDAPAAGTVRLASLYSWRFQALAETRSFEAVFEAVGKDVAPIGLPALPGASGNRDVGGALALGYVGLDHALRDGGRTVSWYRGPLSPIAVRRTMPPFLPIGSADAALRYDPTLGMFDASYAAAWQLGRLIALQSKDFSTRLFAWKHSLRRAVTDQAEHDLLDQRIASDTDGPAFARKTQTVAAVRATLKSLLSDGSHAVPPPPTTPTTDDGSPPEPIAQWLRRLETLHGVPFRYLMPYSAMLPREAIRFFHLDRNWVDALLDGAFSLGSATAGDLAAARGQAFATVSADAPADRPITGFIVRSDGVAHWPNLQATPYDASGQELPIIRYERIAGDVLLCLVDGAMTSVDIHQPPEGLHFGFDPGPNSLDPAQFFKQLRDPVTGANQGGARIDAIPYRAGNQRVVDIDGFAGLVETAAMPALGAETPPRPNITAAEFALMMVEGVGLVRFQLDDGTLGIPRHNDSNEVADA